MQFSKTSTNKFLLRLEKGEEVVGSLKKFCQKQKIKNAAFSGLGSVEDPVLAHYRVDTKKYSEKKLNGIFEVTNLTGNAGLFEDEPLVHAHVSLSDDEMKAFGGHVISMEVSATMEIMLIDLKSSYKKSYNEEIGLKLWDLPEQL